MESESITIRQEATVQGSDKKQETLKQLEKTLEDIKHKRYTIVNKETITLPKKEYLRLKKLEKLDIEFMKGFAKGLKEAKELKFKI